jgi:hypothetical protein
MPSEPLVAVKHPQTVQPTFWTVYHRDGDCVVQCHHGTGRHELQQFVQRQNLGPVRIFLTRRLVMDGGNRRL